jgi:hypothetical protein
MIVILSFLLMGLRYGIIAAAILEYTQEGE